MARRRSFVPVLLVAALVLAIGGITWFALLDGAPAVSHAATAPGEALSAPARADEPPEIAPDAPAPRPSAAEPAPAADERAAVAEGAESELADAIWVEGRVRFPEGTPIDEQVAVVADGKKFERLGDHRALVATDGRFRVAFSRETKTGWLKLDAPHLFAAPLKLKLESLPADITLEPQVGGRITGVIVPPASATDVAEVLKKARVELSGWSSRGDDHVERSSTIDENMRFDLRGIPTHLDYQLGVESQAWAPLSRRDVGVEAGVTKELELSLTLGASLRGRVVDSSDAPLTGVTLYLQVKHDDDFGMQPGKIEKDGTFDLRGIQPGLLTLIASKNGYLDARIEVGELADGEVREDFVLRLDSGNFVAGRVTWPDGAAAAGAYVRVVEPKSKDENEHHFVINDDEGSKVDASGSFRVSGLRPGPYEVWARARESRRPETSPDGQAVKKSGAGSSQWRAHAKEVRSGQEGLVLVLQPGLAVAGRVVDEARAPVTSFSIVARDTSEGRASFMGDGESVTAKFEAADGRFELQGLKEGSWSVVAKAKGFNSNQPALVQVPGDGNELDLTITRCVTLAGVVVDSAGAPVVKANVTARAEQRGYVHYDMNSEPGATTNERGEFEIDDAPSGTVKLSARHASYADSKPSSLSLSAGERRAGLSIVLSNGGAVRGELHASLGAELSGWQVSLMSHEGAGWDNTTSDAAGSFAFERRTPGQYSLQAQPPGEETFYTGAGAVKVQTASFVKRPSETVTIVEGETLRVVLGAPASSPIRVSGRVLIAGKPVTDVEVNVWQQQQQLSANTGADGRYELVVDGAGDYQFSASRDTGGTRITRHVAIPEVASYTLDFELDDGRIAGRVLGSDGEPLENAWVQLQVDVAQAERSSTGVHGWSQTKADGAFDFDGLSPGLYQVSVTDMSARLHGGTSAHGLAHVGGLRIEDGNSIEGLEIRLSEAAFLEGTVRTSSGAPAVGARISVRDEHGKIQTSWWNTTSDGAGYYRVDGLAPGTWTVSARLDREVSDESEPVRLTSGSTAKQDLGLRIGTMLHVVVEDADGKVVGASVSVRDAKGREHASHSYALKADGAGSTGRRIGPLPPGTYAVSASNHDGVQASDNVSLHGQAEQSVTLRLGGS